MDDRLKEILDKIRASANVAGEYASDQVSKAGKKAGEMVEITKLNLQIFDLSAEINTIYKQIGEMIYTTHIDAEAQVDNLEELLVEVDVKKASIEEHKQRITELKQTKKCPNPECGKICSKHDTFCPNCGTSLE